MSYSHRPYFEHRPVHVETVQHLGSLNQAQGALLTVQDEASFSWDGAH